MSIREKDVFLVEIDATVEYSIDVLSSSNKQGCLLLKYCMEDGRV